MAAKPVIRHDLSDEEYRAIDAANFSTIKRIEDSPARAKQVMDHGMVQSPAMFLGELLHCMVLERHEFPRRYELCEFNRRTKAFAEAEEDATRRGLRLYDLSQQGEVAGMVEAVSCNPDAARILDHAMTVTEVVVLWADAVTGVACKCKIDFFNPTERVVGDLKTARSASEDAFGREAAGYFYHAQAAMYHDALDAVYPGGWSWKWIVVEKSTAAEGDHPLHATGVYDADMESLSIGRYYYRNWLRIYRECQESGHWPGYPSRVLRLPKWHVARADELMYEDVE